MITPFNSAANYAYNSYNERFSKLSYMAPQIWRHHIWDTAHHMALSRNNPLHYGQVTTA